MSEAKDPFWKEALAWAVIILVFGVCVYTIATGKADVSQDSILIQE